MANVSLEELSKLNLGKVMETLATRLQANQKLAFLNRTPVPNVLDEEITAKFDGTVLAADIIQDDGEAVVRDYGKYSTTTDRVPNLKHGLRLNQTHLNLLRRLQERARGTEGGNLLSDWKNRRVAALLAGIRMRQEALIVAAKLDSFVYDRLGLKITGSWGTPAPLKDTVDTLWSNTAALPITDMLMMKDYAEETYGRTYNRATMSTTAFRQAVATTQFQNAASLQFRFTVPSNAISPYDPKTRELFEAVSGMQIELYNVRIKEERTDGSVEETRLLPTNKVILSDSADDNNGEVFDLANGIITESIVAEIIPTLLQGLAGEQFGPAAYWAPTSADQNPPGVTAWGVARCFPRKHDETETAILTVAA